MLSHDVGKVYAKADATEPDKGRQRFHVHI